MTITALFPALVAIAGGLLYLLTSDEPFKKKLARIGEIALLAGLIAICMVLGSHVTKI
jgi:hypothetical protein